MDCPNAKLFETNWYYWIPIVPKHLKSYKHFSIPYLIDRKTGGKKKPEYYLAMETIHIILYLYSVSIYAALLWRS